MSLARSPARSSSFALALVVMLGGGCATVPNLGTPPTDDDLLNDGTPEARKALFDEYSIVYESGHFVRSRAGGRSMEVLGEEIEIDESPSASVTSDQAANYVEYSPRARAAMDAWSVNLARFVAGDTGGWVAFGAGTLLGIGLVVGGTVASGYTSGQSTALVLSPLTILSAVFGGVILGGAIGIALYLVTSLGVAPILNAFAADEFRDAARAFNEDLDERIRKNVRVAPPLVPAPPPDVPAGDIPPPPAPAPVEVEPPPPAVDEGSAPPAPDVVAPPAAPAPEGDPAGAE